jgi:hypothetical protein
MKQLTIADYFHYLTSPFKIQSLVIMSALTSIFISFIENNVGISIGLFVVYFIFAMLDMTTGIYKNIILNKEPFSSGAFFKKLLSVGFMLLFTAVATQFSYFLTNIEVPNIVIDEFQSMIVYTVDLIKLFIIIGFFVYEITSLRENFEKMKWYNIVKIIDLCLTPMIWLKNKLQNRIKTDEV